MSAAPILHGYWRSSAAYRVRIALSLKGIAFDQINHDLRTGAQHDADYKTLAPQGLVPALAVEGQVLMQSVAILEWVEERWPLPPLLPAGRDARAVVRAMVGLIACDVHPLNNLRVLDALAASFHATREQVDGWIRRWIGDGFAALETMIAVHGDGFAFGASATLADCVLVPQVYSAERFAVDLAPYPRLAAAAGRAGLLDAFAAAHPSRQPDAGER